MKKISELTDKEFRKIVASNKELRKKLFDRAYDGEQDYMSDKLGCFERGTLDYSLGIDGQSYIEIAAVRYTGEKDYTGFIAGVRKCDKCFCISDATRKLLHRCEKLQEKDSNLIGYWADKLCEVFFHEEFEPTLDWLEDFHYELYCGEVSDKSEGIIELLQDDLEDWLVDDSGKVYKPIAA